ncbi:heterokaryon incompatibility protein-domain-containing protein [Phaeosphaeria sp. MPI-PUGE-AT-0046c]|nr:heterokaryon incompatibility protein-domain-containing protein [Phaeosphaeria sp. MPI-PUGE-AT-0046c]
MRLLRLDPLKRTWVLENFSGPKVPFYAVFSHTWGCDEEEVKFEDLADGQIKYDATNKAGFEKLRFCQAQAERDGLHYFWIDTCCIKKSDSSELQRSLASMFFWYQRAARCYALLSDVSIYDADEGPDRIWERSFAKSRWFKRGWTLQELLAPASVYFFSKENILIGDKKELAATIGAVTRIPDSALLGVELSHFSKDERMSWSTGRITTVPEDNAYCLIGIFDVEIHMLYAEGDYSKRKAVALDKLHKAIAERGNVDERDKVIGIGGANWNDLTALSTSQLEFLDNDLDEFQDWVLDGFAGQYRGQGQFGTPESLTKLSQEAGKRMEALLAKYKVRYDDLSDLEAGMRSWKEPWQGYRNRKAEAQARVQAFVANRWYWMKKNEDIYTGTTALVTMGALMTWRGRWKA